MIINNNSRNSIEWLSLSLLFLVSGFSQIEIGGFKPSDLIIILTFVILAVNGNLVYGFFYLFFCFSFFYAWVIGGFVDSKTLLSSIMIFSIIFSIINFFKYRKEEDIQYFLKLFSYSMFVSNLAALVIFLFIPALVENVVDTSSIGVRFKGFFSQANGYAYVLLLNLPIAIYFLKIKRSLFNISNVLVVVLCIIMAQSRGAILSFMIGIVGVYLIYLLRSGKVFEIIFPSIIAILIGYVAIVILPDILSDNFGINLSRLNPTSEKSSERNITDLGLSDLENDRYYLINAGLTTIKTFPFGLGFQPHHEIIGELTGVFLIPHNYFLTLLLTYGVFIGSIWIIIIFYLIYRGVKIVFSNKINPNNLMFYLTSLVLMVSVFYLTHSSDWSYFYFLIAFYVILCRVKVKGFS